MEKKSLRTLKFPMTLTHRKQAKYSLILGFFLSCRPPSFWIELLIKVLPLLFLPTFSAISFSKNFALFRFYGFSFFIVSPYVLYSHSQIVARRVFKFNVPIKTTRNVIFYFKRCGSFILHINSNGMGGPRFTEMFHRIEDKPVKC